MSDFKPTPSEPDIPARARQRAQEKLDLYKHVSLYLIVIGALAVLNLTTGPGYPWFLWPAAGWGIGIVAHAINVFVSTRDVLERMTQRELRRGQSGLPPKRHGTAP